MQKTNFELRAGMQFIENSTKNSRRVVLVHSKSDGRIWRADGVTSRGVFYIPTARLHERPYHNGWSLIQKGG